MAGHLLGRQRWYLTRDTIAAARARGVERLGVVTRWRLLDRSWCTFTPETSPAPAPLLAQPDTAATA